MRKIVAAAIVASAIGLIVGLEPALAQRALTPVTDAMLRNPGPGDWLMWRRTLDSWGYSPLDQINRSNVARLKMVWTRGLGPGHPGRHAARPRRRHVHAESRATTSRRWTRPPAN